MRPGAAAMMEAARDAARDEAARRSTQPPLVIAVTMLTSLSESNLASVGFASTMTECVDRLARLAKAAGLDGVVASPHEIALIRRSCGDDFSIVTPGIRSVEDERGDQTRTMSAAEALSEGATYLVVGRPIIAAPDPRKAADALRTKLAAGPLTRLTMYSRPGCHLCDEMKEVVRRVSASRSPWRSMKSISPAMPSSNGCMAWRFRC